MLRNWILHLMFSAKNTQARFGHHLIFVYHFPYKTRYSQTCCPNLKCIQSCYQKASSQKAYGKLTVKSCDKHDAHVEGDTFAVLDTLIICHLNSQLPHWVSTRTTRRLVETWMLTEGSQTTDQRRIWNQCSLLKFARTSWHLWKNSKQVCVAVLCTNLFQRPWNEAPRNSRFLLIHLDNGKWRRFSSVAGIVVPFPECCWVSVVASALWQCQLCERITRSICLLALRLFSRSWSVDGQIWGKSSEKPSHANDCRSSALEPGRTLASACISDGFNIFHPCTVHPGRLHQRDPCAPHFPRMQLFTQEILKPCSGSLSRVATQVSVLHSLVMSATVRHRVCSRTSENARRCFVLTPLKRKLRQLSGKCFIRFVYPRNLFSGPQ